MSSKAATHYLQFDIQWASLALLFYDYALTFPLEVKYMWRYKYQHSVILYALCRYALLGNVLYLLAIGGRLSTSCNTIYQFIGALSILGRAAVIVTFTIRTYVVFGQNQFILAYLSMLGLGCIALDITHVPGLRCVGSSSIPIANETLSISMVVFEYSAAILTTVRCIQAFRAAGSSWRDQKGSILYLIFEQGIFYFSIVSLITTAAVILNFRAPSGFLQRLLNALLLPLSGLLTARFLLHLRHLANSSVRLDGRNEISTAGTSDSFVSSFHALGNTISSSLDDFGDDPVARVKNAMTTFESDVEMASAAGPGSHVSNADKLHTEIDTHRSTPNNAVGPS